REYDAILGNDEKYIRDVCEAAEETHPTFIAVFGSPIAAMTGTDFKGVARVIEKRTGIPTLHFDTSGMHTYQAGMRQAFRALAERFVDEKNAPVKNTDAIKINLLGLTPLDFSVVGNVEALLDWCAAEGFDVISSWAMHTTLSDIARSAEADVNLVLSSTALDAAKVLQERFGTPYVVGLPMGADACRRIADLLKEAARTGENKTLWDETASSAPDAPRTLVLGEPVFAASLRWVLGDRNTRVLCPLEDPCGCLRETDLQSWREPVIRAALAEADVIYADPLYRNLLPSESLDGTSPKEFHDVPSENYSGRMYRDRIPVFLGPDFKP
ncbi:MAG: nitrogenase component 1, partial [Eubacteriales bacterium]|nr:nitrogenase component 1 [Eubacteriales bacterium]